MSRSLFQKLGDFNISNIVKTRGEIKNPEHVPRIKFCLNEGIFFDSS